jgi:hypothetical protein
VDVGVEAVALAKGEASVEETAFVPSESTMLWGRCMGVMVALPLFVLGTSSLLMAAGTFPHTHHGTRTRTRTRTRTQTYHRTRMN